MKILITGGFGYLGSLIASFLVKKPGVTLLLASREKRTVPRWLPNAKALKVIWEDDKNIESIKFVSDESILISNKNKDYRVIIDNKIFNVCLNSIHLKKIENYIFQYIDKKIDKQFDQFVYSK